MRTGSSRARRLARFLLPLGLLLGWLFASACGGGGDSPRPPSSQWDSATWDQGTWQ